MTIREDQLRALHTRLTMAAKQHLCRDGPDDIPPFMIVQFADGCVYTGALDDDLGNGLNPGLIGAASTHVLWLEHGCTALACATLVLEGHGLMNPNPDQLDKHQRGDLAKRFASQPDSRVTELMITSHFEWDDDHLACSMVTHPFHYDDGGKLVWDEPIVALDGEGSGLIVNTFRRFWEEQHG